MDIKREFAKDTIIYGLGNGIKKTIGLFLLPFYTRALSPEEYGILGTVATFTLFVSALLNCGLDSATGFYFFKAKSEDEKGSILFSHFLIRLLGIIPPLILSFFSYNISKLLFKSPDYAWIVFISIILVPVNLLMSEQSHIYRYLRQPWRYNLVTIVKALVNIGVGVSLVVVLNRGILGARIASIVSSSVVVIGSLLLYTRKIYTYRFSWMWMRRMFKFGFPLIWAGMATWIYNSSDRFFLLHYSSLDEIGFYSVGTTFSQPILLLNLAVQMSFGVLFFKLYHEDTDPDKKQSKQMAIESFNLYLITAVLIAVLLSIFSKEIVEIIATKDYSKGAMAIPFLTFSFIAAQGYNSMGPGISVAEKTWHYTWITAMTAIINILLNFLLIPAHGFVGAAFSTFLSFLIYWITKLLVSLKYFYIPYPFFRLFAYYLIGFLIAFSIPFLDFYRDIQISVFLKVFTFLLMVLLGISMKFVKINFKTRL